MNKPYCWLLNGEVWFKEPKETDKEFDGYEITPLYTHPVKELTDKEIQELANIHLAYQIEDSRVSGVFDFADAILRKAQEK